jgi:NitT/TauT family transport system permease protein
MFGSQSGLGYLLMTAIGLQNIQVIMSVTLLLVLVAATVNTLLRSKASSPASRRAMPARA